VRPVRGPAAADPVNATLLKEYGFTDFEHYGSIMPNWGGIANDYNPAANPGGAGVVENKTAVLTQAQINLLIQFIRQWETYSTLP